MNKLLFVSVASVASVAILSSLTVGACGDDDNIVGGVDASLDGSGLDGSDTGNAYPAPPNVGTQIDRFGRPAVNTALTHTFDPNATSAGAAKDAYNAQSDPAAWVETNRAEIAKNLAILDSLDQGIGDNGGCGNQPFADDDAGAKRYEPLASVLGSDKMWINTASASCTTYLAVELNATGVAPNADCGGRKLAYDVIDTTYSVVSGVGLTGFGDDIAADPAKTSGTTFPYLADPL